MAKLTKKRLGTTKASTVTAKSSTPVGGEAEFDASNPDKGGAVTVIDGDATVVSPTDASMLDLVEAIKSAHDDTVHAASSVVVAAARAGSLLAEARSKLSSEVPFTKWVQDNLPMSWRTAYDYIKVDQAMKTHALDVAGCTSVRQVLQLVSSKEQKDPKEKDPKVESFVTHAAAIERWYLAEIEKAPVEDWDPARRQTIYDMLKEVASIARKIKPGKDAKTGVAGVAVAAGEPATTSGEATTSGTPDATAAVATAPGVAE